MPYNYTVYPNYIGHFSQLEAEEDLEAYDALVDVKCYELASLFLCTLFVPKCGKQGLIPPCKSLCLGNEINMPHTRKSDIKRLSLTYSACGLFHLFLQKRCEGAVSSWVFLVSSYRIICHAINSPIPVIPMFALATNKYVTLIRVPWSQVINTKIYTHKSYNEPHARYEAAFKHTFSFYPYCRRSTQSLFWVSVRQETLYTERLALWRTCCKF